jgi:site-specific DNA-methyltransferase (cytosine-N4-specific)
MREGKGHTLRSFSSALGVDPAYLSRVEAGKVPPSQALLTRAAVLLGADPDELLIMSGRLPSGWQEAVRLEPTAITTMFRGDLQAFMSQKLNRPEAWDHERVSDVKAAPYRADRGPVDLPKATWNYSTPLGRSYLGDSLSLLPQVEAGSVNLVVTSPPYALHFKKEYGNAPQDEYLEWFRPFAREVHRVLADDGSFVVDIGGSYRPKMPVRSLYHFKLLVMLCEEFGYHLAQEFFWYNPAKMPAPAEWVTVRRIRVRDSVNCIWWLCKTPFPKADNRRVLQEYSPDMLRLIKRGYTAKRRPSGHVITDKWAKDQGGSIPPNLLEFGNNDSNGAYLKACSQAGLSPHPARFPPNIPGFFVRFLTDEGDLVLDPFAGSNTTGYVAESLGRRWLSFEVEEKYVMGGQLRFATKAPPPQATVRAQDTEQESHYAMSLFGGEAPKESG